MRQNPSRRRRTLELTGSRFTPHTGSHFSILATLGHSGHAPAYSIASMPHLLYSNSPIFSKSFSPVRRSQRLKRTVLALSGSIALLLAPRAFPAGVVRTWDGGGNGNLRNNPNWNGDTIPTFNGNANGNTDALLFTGAPSSNAGNTSLTHVNTAAAEATYGHQVKNITFDNSVSGGPITSYTFDAAASGSQTFVLGDTSSVAGTGLNT